MIRPLWRNNFVTFKTLKKLASILLLSLLFFNWYGYRFLFSHLENKATNSLISRIDDGHYEESDLVEYKIPAALGYQSYSPEYETVHGEARINGKFMRYVKRKFVNDTIYLLCINNTGKNELESARHEFFLLANDMSENEDQSSSKQIKPNLAEFLPELFYSTAYVSPPISTSFTMTNEPLIRFFEPSDDGQPPEMNT